MRQLLQALAVSFFICTVSWAQLQSNHIEWDFTPDANASKPVWKCASDEVTILADWQANREYPYLATSVKSLWSDKNLYLIYVVPFDSISSNASIKSDPNGDSWAIWNYDVVEVFITDNPDIKRYFEFVISPLGQKIDIVHNKNLPKARSFDTGYTSGWKTAVAVDNDKKLWIAEIRIPFKAISISDVHQGKKYHINLFRCHGSRHDRIYMTMNATGTANPDFHVPEHFGVLELVKAEPISSPVFYLNCESGNGKDVLITQVGSASVTPEKYVSEVITEGAGVAGSNCVDFENASAEKLLCYNDPNMLDMINGMYSFTITGWFKTKVNFDDSQSKFILGCPNRFRLTAHGLYKGRMGVDILGFEKKSSGVWSSWFAPFLAEERWIFFAFSYNGTADVNNAAVCVGTEEYEIESEISSIDAGPLKPKASTALILGNCEKRGANIFQGKLDNIRIFADKHGAKGSLTRQQIELLRKTDVGSVYAAKLRKKRQFSLFQKQAKLEGAQNAYWSKPFNALLIDSLDRVFSDVPPMPSESSQPVSVPRGSKAVFQVAIGSKINTRVHIGPVKISSAANEAFTGNSTVYKLLTVHVEANNNGGSRTSLTSCPPAMWLEKAIRKAPFDVAEVLVPVNSFDVNASKFAAILLDINIPADSKPGLYSGQISFNVQDSNQSATVPFTFYVHKTRLPSNPILHSVHWLWPEPENLVYGKEVPLWWSQQHWELLAAAGLQLRAFGQDTMYTPIIDGLHPLIKTVKKSDGNFSFDFSKFDRWIELFSSQGFIEFDGHHIAGGHHVKPVTVVAVDEKTGKTFELFTADSDPDKWFDFVPVFYKQFYAHLNAKGWLGRYRQCQLDEPGDFEDYEKLAQLATTYMPGVLTKDAINSNPEKYSPFVDIQVFGISTLATGRQLAEERKRTGKLTWFYHCASPYPPNPNRHLDDPLSMSRLYPWYAYLFEAQGYLNWAANVYRGADPYKTSIGPIPGGSQNPGHPAGDNWFFYPGPDGLRSSMRMVAFRDGMVDYTLLVMLAHKNKAAADKIMQSIARSLIDYQRDCASYHKARRQMLTLLDSLNKYEYDR